MTLVRLISTCLALCVIVTSGMAATLRIDPGTGQFVTICADGRSVSVELDHTGAPIDPRHHCPDCISVVVLTPSYDAPAATLVETQLTATTVALSLIIARVPVASARAPPLSV